MPDTEKDKLTLPGVVESVLHPAAALEYVRVVRIVEPLADDLDGPESEVPLHVGLALPLRVLAVPPAVVALHHLRGEPAGGRTANALELEDGGGPVAGGDKL